MNTLETINLDTLTKDQAVEILQGMAASVAFLFNALDQDGDGRLSPAEIDAAPEVLRSLDKDGDGKISKDEAPQQMQSFFDRMDSNGDGFIDKAEQAKLRSMQGGGGRTGAGGGGGRPGGRPK